LAQAVSLQTAEINMSSSPSGLSKNGLASGVLSSLETFAQSVAGIAPSAAPAMTAAIVVGMAGNGAWLTYLISIGILVLTALCINAYAVRSADPGALYSYVTDGGGKYAGFISGWAMLLAYVLGVAVCSIQFAVFANEVLKDLLAIQLPALVWITACLFTTCAIACRNIKLSAEIMLWLEVVSLVIIMALCSMALIHLGWTIDFAQLNLSGVSNKGVLQGLVMALFGFVGFESAATLGAEAENPKQKIPQALMSSVICAGVFFVFTTYSMVFLFKSIPDVPLATCTTPLLVMSERLGVPWLGKLTNFGAAVSFFACCLAATNAAARIMMSMGADSLLPTGLGAVNHKYKTPAVAVNVASGAGFIPAAILVISGQNLLDIVDWLGTLATYGYLVAYFLVACTCCFFLKRNGELKPVMVIVASLSALMTLAAFAGTMFPIPTGVHMWLPYLCLGYLAVGALQCWCSETRRSRSVPVLHEID
jgi:amino acid transporter